VTSVDKEINNDHILKIPIRAIKELKKKVEELFIFIIPLLSIRIRSSNDYFPDKILIKIDKKEKPQKSAFLFNNSILIESDSDITKSTTDKSNSNKKAEILTDSANIALFIYVTSNDLP
jgi:hypothetical protein